MVSSGRKGHSCYKSFFVEYSGGKNEVSSKIRVICLNIRLEGMVVLSQIEEVVIWTESGSRGTSISMQWCMVTRGRKGR